jgi:hypothetical protein
MCFVSEFSVEIWITETFWIDLFLRNPLDAEVNLSNVTVFLEESDARDSSSTSAFVEVELVENVVLAPKESLTVRRCQGTPRHF